MLWLGAAGGIKMGRRESVFLARRSFVVGHIHLMTQNVFRACQTVHSRPAGFITPAAQVPDRLMSRVWGRAGGGDV